MYCEACGGSLPEKKYGSGRFCQQSCSRSFSTRAKREEISVRVSQSMKGRMLGGTPGREPRVSEEKKCGECGKLFTTIRKATFCGKSCSTKNNNKRSEVRERLSIARIEAIKNGKENHKSTRCTYLFKGTEVRCDSKLEYACLDWFERNYVVVSMSRNTIPIKYLFEGFERRFLPDFRIETATETFIVEVKGILPEGYLNKKWGKYRENSIPKRAALEEYASREGLTPLWFTMEMHRKFYRSLKF